MFDFKARKIYTQLSVDELIKESLRRKEGALAKNNALSVYTGKHTGRSPGDRFIVDTKDVHDKIAWGRANKPISEKNFKKIKNAFKTYLKDKEVFLSYGYAGARRYSIKLKIITELASQSLFSRQMFIRPKKSELKNFTPGCTVIACPNLFLEPSSYKINSETVIALDFTENIMLIAGTRYSGEIKKSIFSYLNYWLPEKNVFPMHCSASIYKNETALFFGLSGTGKTTLSADHDMKLIGDDEHGWSTQGIFNFEGGCYAKCINLNKKKEPRIWNAIKAGSLVENAVMKKGEFDFSDSKLTENTRAAYPLEHMKNIVVSGQGNHPKTIIFLTADAFGVLPPVSKLSIKQAMYHFISGYTSKIPGTEKEILAPEPTFSTCFGAPFMPRPAITYANMLAQRLKEHKTDIYLVNTGWTKCPCGTGERIPIKLTRKIVHAALDGRLKRQKTKRHKIFNLEFYIECPNVPKSILSPEDSWQDKKEYDMQARKLASMFIENFKKFNLDKLEKHGPRQK